MSKLFSTDFAGRTISLKTDYVAGQADGAVLATYGDTVVLVTAVSLKAIREGTDFLPLTVDYQEMTFAAGKIPGGFFKREGRPNEKEILTSRIIDRSIGPLFYSEHKDRDSHPCHNQKMLHLSSDRYQQCHIVQPSL